MLSTVAGIVLDDGNRLMIKVLDVHYAVRPVPRHSAPLATEQAERESRH